MANTFYQLKNGVLIDITTSFQGHQGEPGPPGGAIDMTGAETNFLYMFNGNEAVWAAEGTDFRFLIDSFTTNQASTQLMGEPGSTWLSAGEFTATASYNRNVIPNDAVIEALPSIGWAGGELLGNSPYTNWVSTQIANYPISLSNVIFTLKCNNNAAAKAITINFCNTTVYGITATNGTFENGANENRFYTFTANAGIDQYVVFKFPTRLGNVGQVLIGGVTASFNPGNRATVTPAISTPTNYTNSNGFTELFTTITSANPNTGSISNQVQILSSTTPKNYTYCGTLNHTTNITQNDIKDNYDTRLILTSQSATLTCRDNSITQYPYIAYPTRFPALSSIQIGGFEYIDDFTVVDYDLLLTNDLGFQEAYRVYMCNTPGFENPTTMQVM